MKISPPKTNPIGNVVKNVPFLSLPDRPLVTSTQEQMPIADITDEGLVLFKDGGASVILESTSLNFGLLSEKEQEAVIYAYAALLNSLSYTIQIVVRSQRKDISNYLTYLDRSYQKLTNPKLKELMAGYKSFISETIKKKNVLGKRFFVVIPFSPLELGVTKSFLSVTKRKGPLPFPKSYIIKKAAVALFPKRDHLIRQAGRLGIKLTQVQKEEIITLFYDVFNPSAPVIRSNEQATKA
ncbi:MAG TPA: hypothetical protein VF185_02155 [Patescibacteria group bacterium]